jgi:hypothetical protein
MMGSLASVAPSEIKPDAQIIARAYADLFKTLDEVDFDVTRLAAGSGQELDEPKVRRASDRLNAYYRDVCRLNVG